MTKQTPETPSNIEIGSFKTPEELAEALEAKSKIDLAKRIRIISGQVQDTSTDLRQRLQDELTPQEHGEIRETLQNSGVATVFTKGLSGEEKAIQVAQKEMAGIIGEENTQSLQKVEGIWNRLSTGFDKIGDIFSEKGMVAGIGAIILMFKGIFSGDFSQLDAILNPKEKDKKEGRKDSNGKKDMLSEGLETQYILGINALYTLGNTNKIHIKGVLHSKDVHSKTFNDLQQESKNSNGIATRLKLTAFSDEQVLQELQILLNSEKRIQGLLGKDFPNWREENLIKIVDLLNQKGFLTVGKLKEKLDNINFSFNPTQAIGELFSGLGELLNVSLKDGEVHFGDIGEDKKLLGDVSKELLLGVISSKTKITASTKDTELIQTIGGKKPEDDIFLTKFIQFKDAIFPQLKILLPNDNQKDISEFFNNRGLSQKDLFELYLITGGETNLQNLGGVKMIFLYVKFGSILSKDNEGLAGALANKLHEQILTDDPIIPEEVKNFFADILNIIGTSVIKKGVGLTKDIWEFTDTSTKAIIGGLIGAYFLSKKVRYIISGVGTAATAFIAMKIWDSLNSDTKKKLKDKHQISNATDLDKKLGEVI